MKLRHDMIVNQVFRVCQQTSTFVKRHIFESCNL